jgi:hypothetical protein
MLKDHYFISSSTIQQKERWLWCSHWHELWRMVWLQLWIGLTSHVLPEQASSRELEGPQKVFSPFKHEYFEWAWTSWLAPIFPLGQAPRFPYARWKHPIHLDTSTMSGLTIVIGSTGELNVSSSWLCLAMPNTKCLEIILSSISKITSGQKEGWLQHCHHHEKWCCFNFKLVKVHMLSYNKYHKT